MKIALDFDMETAFSHSPTGLFVRITCFRHLRDPNEQFGTRDKLPWASKVGQKSSQTKSVSVEKTYEKVSITVTAVFENMLPDDISTPYRET